MPPFFPDLAGCRGCTVGAAYVRVRVRVRGYSNTKDKPELACFNKRCYSEKLEAGAAAYREKLEDHKKGLFREDRETAQRFTRNLKGPHRDTLRALATTIVAQTDKLELQHPFWEFIAEWSYESRATTRIREILGLDLRTGTRGVDYLEGDGLAALENVADVDLRELVANLMLHHLRIAGKMDTVSRGTATELPDQVAQFRDLIC